MLHNDEVWVVWPTVHVEQSNEISKEWQRLGFKTCVLVNDLSFMAKLKTDMKLFDEVWKGFPSAANLLCKNVPGDLVIVIGDDIYPDSQVLASSAHSRFLGHFPDTYGVLQPTGDDFGATSMCAVSPWIGRKFIEQSYNGKGPYFEGYFHYFCDEELQVVATKQGVFVQDPSVCQYHDHWQRRNEERPAHLGKAFTQWGKDRELFTQRKRNGFPGSERKEPRICHLSTRRT